MKYGNFHHALLIAVTFVLSACGGGSGTTPPASSLAGVWYGHYDQAGTSRELQFTVSGSNSISAVLIDGTDMHLTGVVAHDQGNLYLFTLYSGATLWDAGGILLDSASQHAAFLGSAGDVGVVQKAGTTPVAGYAVADIGGSWSGDSLTLDTAGTVTGLGASNMAVVNGTFTFSGTDLSGYTFSGSGGSAIAISDPVAGSYSALFDNATAGITNGNMKVWLSPDKTFAAAYLCDGSAITPTTGLDRCSYEAWVKQ